MPRLIGAGALAATLLACLPAESQDIPVRIAADLAATFGSDNNVASGVGGEDGVVAKDDPTFAEPWDEPDWMMPPVEQDFSAPRSTTPLGPTFTVLHVDNSYYRCCPSPLFRMMMQALKAHPLYRSDPKDAEVIFFYHDTLRMCEWPHLAMKQTGSADVKHGSHFIGCVDAGGDSHDGQSFVHAKDHHHTCDWCCTGATDVFTTEMDQVIKQYGDIHTFIYWKNSGDNFFKCQEFVDTYKRLRNKPVRYVGIQLQKSQFADDDATVEQFGVGGVNILVPLFPSHYAMPEADSFRDLCVPDRPWLASFSGQLGFSPIRKEVFKLADKHPRFHIYRTDKFGGEDPEGYEQILRHSIFGLVPRGDEHYTFRLTEVLAAGAVPVLIDDDFVSLYGDDNISSWAVRLKEKSVHTAPDLLDSISADDICAMKKRGTEIFHYAQDIGHTVDGVLSGLWRMRPGQATAPMTASTASGTVTTSTTETGLTYVSSTIPEQVTADSIANMTFTVVEEDVSMGPCCTTPFFQDILDAMHIHPDYTNNPNEAHAIILRHDSLRMCAWPDEASDHCEAASEDASEDEGGRDCGFCCSTSTGIFLEAVRSVVEKYGKNHTFVYFKNVQDEAQSCSEFEDAKAETSKLGLDVRFVGFDLRASELSKKGADDDMWDYPLPGVNLLVPLSPKRAAIEESKETRGDCMPRTYIASFCGPMGGSNMQSESIWDKVQSLGDATNFKISEDQFCGGEDQEAYDDVLRDSVFGIVPKGSQRHRLTEVIAAGAVPVIIDDDFLAPYALGDLEKWSVRVPEDEVGAIPDKLEHVSNRSVCEMKKRGAGLMHFARTLEATVDGLIFGLRLTAAGAQSKTMLIQGRAFQKDGSLMVSANAPRPSTTTQDGVMFVSGHHKNETAQQDSSDPVRSTFVFLGISAGVLLMAAVIGAVFGAGFGGQSLSALVRGGGSKGALGLEGNGQYVAAPGEPSNAAPPRGLQALFGGAGGVDELADGCAEAAQGAVARVQRAVAWAGAGCQRDGSESLLRGNGEVEMAADEAYFDDGAVWVCLNCAAVNKASQMVCSREGCQTRQTLRPQRRPSKSSSSSSPSRTQKKPDHLQDRPDPFWDNRGGEVGVPGLGLIEGNQPPPTLNSYGEAQSRGNTAKLIASSISKAVKQADERHGQRQAPHAEPKAAPRADARPSASGPAASPASTAARNVSQIAATSRGTRTPSP